MFYDIRFTALVPNDGKPIELIINIEAQNDFHPGYQDEFEIEVTPHLEKGGSEMCNLSEGIEKRGDTKRMLIVVKNMIKKGKYAPEEIAEISGMPIEKVLELINGKTA